MQHWGADIPSARQCHARPNETNDGQDVRAAICFAGMQKPGPRASLTSSRNQVSYLYRLPKVISKKVGDALLGVAANRQVCPTFSEITFGNHSNRYSAAREHKTIEETMLRLDICFHRAGNDAFAPARVTPTAGGQERAPRDGVPLRGPGPRALRDGLWPRRIAPTHRDPGDTTTADRVVPPVLGRNRDG